MHYMQMLRVGASSFSAIGGLVVGAEVSRAHVCRLTSFSYSAYFRTRKLSCNALDLMCKRVILFKEIKVEIK